MINSYVICIYIHIIIGLGGITHLGGLVALVEPAAGTRPRRARQPQPCRANGGDFPVPGCMACASRTTERK